MRIAWGLKSMGMGGQPCTGAAEFEEAGIFTWNVGADMVFGDSTIATLYGFAVDTSLGGQKMSAYLDRVHPDDLGAIALNIHEAITTEAPYHCEYRVRDGNEEYRPVASFGRCFRSVDRETTQFAGIVYPLCQGTLPLNPLHEACQAAVEAARQSGRQDVAAKLAEIALTLNERPRPISP